MVLRIPYQNIMPRKHRTQSFHKSRIPKEWTIGRLVDCCSDKGIYGINAAAVEHSSALPRYLRITDIDGDGRYSARNMVSVAATNYEDFLLENGDIVFVRTGATVGKSYLYDSNDGELVYAGFLIRFRPDGCTLLPEFLKQFTETKLYWDWVKTVASRSGQPGINAEEYGSLKLPLPHLGEQKVIVRVLRTMDELIRKTNRLIEQKKNRKKYLMQTLLTGKKRLKGFRGKWKTLPFRELATESVFRNGGKMSNDRLMAVSKVHGMVPMRERVQGESNHRCKVVRQNYFAYNPMRLNIGSLARWDGEEPAMVSGDYVVFKCEEDRLDPRFFDFYRSTNEWANYVRRAGDGSVRGSRWRSAKAISAGNAVKAASAHNRKITVTTVTLSPRIRLSMNRKTAGTST